MGKSKITLPSLICSGGLHFLACSIKEEKSFCFPSPPPGINFKPPKPAAYVL